MWPITSVFHQVWVWPQTLFQNVRVPNPASFDILVGQWYIHFPYKKCCEKNCGDKKGLWALNEPLDVFASTSARCNLRSLKRFPLYTWKVQWCNRRAKVKINTKMGLLRAMRCSWMNSFMATLTALLSSRGLSENERRILPLRKHMYDKPHIQHGTCPRVQFGMMIAFGENQCPKLHENSCY